jgi:hypothetical protein
MTNNLESFWTQCSISSSVTVSIFWNVGGGGEKSVFAHKLLDQPTQASKQKVDVIVTINFSIFLYSDGSEISTRKHSVFLNEFAANKLRNLKFDDATEHALMFATFSINPESRKNRSSTSFANCKSFNANIVLLWVLR